MGLQHHHHFRKALSSVTVGGASASSHPPYVVQNLPNMLVSLCRLLAKIFLTPCTIFTVLQAVHGQVVPPSVGGCITSFQYDGPHSKCTRHFASSTFRAQGQTISSIQVASHHKDRNIYKPSGDALLLSVTQVTQPVKTKVRALLSRRPEILTYKQSQLLQSSHSSHGSSNSFTEHGARCTTSPATLCARPINCFTN